MTIYFKAVQSFGSFERDIFQKTLVTFGIWTSDIAIKASAIFRHDALLQKTQAIAKENSAQSMSHI